MQHGMSASIQPRCFPQKWLGDFPLAPPDSGVNYTGPTTSASISHETKKLLIIAASIINARPFFLPRKVSKQRIFLAMQHGVKMAKWSRSVPALRPRTTATLCHLSCIMSASKPSMEKKWPLVLEGGSYLRRDHATERTTQHIAIKINQICLILTLSNNLIVCFAKW